MASPNDPLMTGFGWIELGYDDLEGVLVEADGHIHRAAAQRRVAEEMGVAFEEVTARVAYVRALTRAEAWDDYGREQYDDWNGGPENVPDDWEAGEGSWFFTYVKDPTLTYPTPVHKVWHIS